MFSDAGWEADFDGFSCVLIGRWKLDYGLEIDLKLFQVTLNILADYLKKSVYVHLLYTVLNPYVVACSVF